MPAFSAINLEPEESFEDEVDTTKELQIDEALKQFQTALKLHAQGPQFFDEAADAYNALFESEIFKFPESKTEFERADTHRGVPNATEQPLLPGIEIATGDVDGIANSLPQMLFLSHKNHGQFVLDRIRNRVRFSKTHNSAVVDSPEILDDARRALDNYATALDWDPSDAELWRRTARVSAFLKSARISRYSLEAAIELDDDPAVVEVEPPSLAEGFAGMQLKNQLDVLGDTMALTHPAMDSFRGRDMPSLLKRHLDPLPFLPDATRDLVGLKAPLDNHQSSRIVIDVSNFSWYDVGMALVRFDMEEGSSGQAVFLQLPEIAEEDDVQMEIDRQLQPPEETNSIGKKASEQPVEDENTDQHDQNVLTSSKDEGTINEESAVAPEKASKDRAVPQPSRKRSQSTAGLPETQDEEAGETKRSKRTRRRDTAVEEVMDPATRLTTQLQPYQAADQNLFQTTKNILENLGVTDHVTLDRLAEVLDSCASDDRAGRISNVATTDLRDTIVNFQDDYAKTLLSKKQNPELGLATLLEHTMASSHRNQQIPTFDEARGLKQFVDQINSGWCTIHDVAYAFVECLTKSYTVFKWSERMKTAVVQVTSRLDGSIYAQVLHLIERYQQDEDVDGVSRVRLVVQMLFELHLDVYDRITNPNSAVEHRVRVKTRWRLGRWLELATHMIQGQPKDLQDPILLRFLWASVFSTSFADGVSQEHVLGCWNSLRGCLAKDENENITLPNNAIMPEVSPAAAEKEISKLTTMKFFLGLFKEDLNDPVSTIETLEPVLNPESVFVSASNLNSVEEDDDPDVQHDTLRKPITDCASQGLRDLWKLLRSSSTELRLFLWTRLAGAYGKINYGTKQFSCLLRSIEMIVTDLEQEESYLNTPPESRRALLLDMLNSLDDVLVAALQLALSNNDSFDIIDEDHLRTTSSALAKLSCHLHVAAMFEDEVRIGMTQSPGSGSSWTGFLNKLREMQVRTWCLQYMVLKVGIHQEKSMFPKPESDLADYLAAVHQVLGLRKCCKVSNKIFLKMMRVELLKQKNIENWEDYLGQVLYDLYGLKLGVGIWEVQDHGCPAETLEKKQAIQLVDKIVVLANRMSMKDLLKSDLKTSIEHIQQAIGSTRSTSQMIHNLRNFTEYLKKPIHPLRLYQALKGNVTLDVITVNTGEGALAKQGWFFLLGMMALTRFKGVDLNRRQTPGATDDLRLGATFLRLQLQFTPDRWEAWFRLAECFDYELDEAVLWTADKMNKDRAELVKFQRNSIHCYTLALSHARNVESDLAVSEAKDVLHDLFHNFGMRLYASSREPFAMEPFRHADQQRFFIENMGAGTFKKIIHEEMSSYKVWKYAAKLFRQAMAGRPKDWKNPYMLSKCLWKMYQTPLEALDSKDREIRPTVENLIAALENTIEVVSALPKPRHGQDPILEPHYKILSIVHKLVIRGNLSAQEGVVILQRQSYTPQSGEDVAIADNEEWEGYVLKCLRHLRDKDKSNWQHRLIIRHARILFDNHDNGSDAGYYMAAKAAFTVLRESMFTKTMVMNVWKCDAERPGRHHVYTEQYISLMVQLLAVMKDRTNMEAVLRRIRKKGVDFYHFNELWQTCVLSYLRLVRQSHRVPLTDEDIFKSLTPEEFEIVSERINDWVVSPEAEEHPAMVALKEVVELKKLNANLMKAGPIDDLIADCYAFIYTDVGPSLPGPSLLEVLEERNRLKEEALRPEGLTSTKASHSLLHPQDSEPTTLGSLRASPERPEQGEKMEKQLSSTGDPSHRGRRPGVRRPDVLRRAEQAVLRAAEGPPKSAGTNGPGRKSRLGSMSSGKNGVITPGDGVQGDGDTEEEDEDGEAYGTAAHSMVEGDSGEVGDEDLEMGDADADPARGEMRSGKNDIDGASEASSPPGSVHDSADDESELSDIPPDYDEDTPPSLMFPNLRKGVDTGRGSIPDGTGSSDAGSVRSDETEEEDGEDTEADMEEDVEVGDNQEHAGDDVPME